jgi:phosphoglycerol transferase
MPSVTNVTGAASSVLVRERGLTRARIASWWPYPSVALLSVVLVVAVLQLWRVDFRVPFTYHGEAMYNGMLVKGILEHGWHLSNPALGAPTGADLRDVPMSDNNLHFLMIKLMRLGTSNYARAMNIFFMLTFPLIAVSALFAFRQFGIGVWPALCGSLLFTFLPFHFGRGQHHLFLAAYYLVPLAIMVTLWITLGAVSLLDERRRWSWRHCHSKLLGSAIICVLLASAGVYYAFFACFFFLVAGVLVALRRRDARHLVLSVALVGVITAVLAVHYVPSILHVWRHGDTQVIRRSPMDAETYGLRLWQLLLPVTGHRLAVVARFRDAINTERGGFNETDVATLGVIGSVGFLALLSGLLFGKPGATRWNADVTQRALHDVRILNLLALSLALTGGFGSIVALLVTAKIRAYNRISIFIAFFALFAVVVWLDALYRRQGSRPVRRGAVVAGLAVLLGFGVLDQTSGRTADDYLRVGPEYGSDSTFVHELEAVMPPQAMIFQLPIVPFPEYPSVHRMHDYDHGRGYLHSKTLRWSYGALKGREGEAWQRWAVDKPVREMIETLAAAGFSGLYLNRAGYADRGESLVRQVSSVLGQRPLTTHDDRLLFFDLTDYRQALRVRHTVEEWEAKQEAALHPPLMIWQYGCSDPEGTPENNFRWCAASGEWHLINRARRTRPVTLEMSFMAPHWGNLRLESPLFSEQLRLTALGPSLSRTIALPPGEHTIRFACDARPALASGDRRPLVFRVINFSTREGPAIPPPVPEILRRPSS